MTFTDHALEPNEGRLEEIIKEIFRCTNGVCIFTEPSNELASAEGIERMKKLGGYILDQKDLTISGSLIATPYGGNIGRPNLVVDLLD